MRFEVILADPPWRYEFSKASLDRIENHYPTMSLDDICSLPVASLAAANAVLFLWTTSPKLNEAFPVMSAWGFEYKTSIVWHKLGPIGMGYYARIDHELLLIATRGKPPVPRAAARTRSVVAVPKTRHSQKPGLFHQIIERMYPEARRLELFCRAPRPGWHAWGNQAEGMASVTGQGELLDLDLPRGLVLPLDALSGASDG